MGNPSVVPISKRDLHLHLSTMHTQGGGKMEEREGQGKECSCGLLVTVMETGIWSWVQTLRRYESLGVRIYAEVTLCQGLESNIGQQ